MPRRCRQIPRMEISTFPFSQKFAEHLLYAQQDIQWMRNYNLAFLLRSFWYLNSCAMWWFFSGWMDIVFYWSLLSVATLCQRLRFYCPHRFALNFHVFLCSKTSFNGISKLCRLIFWVGIVHLSSRYSWILFRRFLVCHCDVRVDIYDIFLTAQFSIKTRL